jgi:NADH-quinone oxidoreductase subunit D
VLAVEKLMNVEVPPRAQVIRVILCELQRIASHLVWLGTHAIDLAAMSLLLYCFREREIILDLFEMVSGQRMMASYFRIGGLWRDVPAGFEDAVRQFLNLFPARVDEYEALLRNNPLWLERTRGIGVISAADAVAMGVTGPSLRGSGINWDVRKAEPYSSYDQFEFDVPLGETGDVYARYWCRMQELRQSVKIIDQALKRLPKGPFITGDRKVAPPPKEELAWSMESLIHHFKLWTEGFTPPPGEVYVSVESPRGEFGCYINSDGSPKPRRVHFRTPSFANLAALPMMSKNALVADVVAIIGSIDIVLGDIDR